MNTDRPRSISGPDGPSPAQVYRLAFGKYRGQPLSEVPEGALRHYLGWDALYTDVRQEIEAELARRTAGDPSGPDQGVLMPLMPDLVTGCAIALVEAGERALLVQHPSHARTIREAGGLLLDFLNKVANQSEQDDIRDDVVF